MNDTQRPLYGELSPSHQLTRERRAEEGTEYQMNNIEDRIREDLSLIRIRIETFDYGEKGQYNRIGYLSALIQSLFDAMSSINPESLRSSILQSLNHDNQMLMNSEHIPAWNQFFMGRVESLANVLQIIAKNSCQSQ